MTATRNNFGCFTLLCCVYILNSSIIFKKTREDTSTSMRLSWFTQHAVSLLCISATYMQSIKIHIANRRDNTFLVLYLPVVFQSTISSVSARSGHCFFQL